ncbi:MAG: DNA ligase D [Bacteriovoracaceae bacterium]|nr:DNA ligase D [Bacteriovoracaceae bacterium]
MQKDINLYNKKRDFSKTREPKGEVQKSTGDLFVVQEHFASRHHFDFRLEINGVLKSWAVPKGPSLNPKDKRLAVHVEDHPLDYANFEGVIPKGEYGGGKVILWDKGRWFCKDADKDLAYKAGKLEFRLEGEKLHGNWILTRTKMGKNERQENWLLIKLNDDAADSTTDITKAHQESIVKHKDHLDISPQLATLTTSAPKSNTYFHEIKFDGYRTIAKLNQGHVDIFTRSGKNWTHRYPVIARELMQESILDTILDGEIVHLDGNGQTSFSCLQQALKESNHDNLYYYVFDVLKMDGDWVMSLPQEIRKGLCYQILKEINSPRILFSEHFTEPAQQVFTQTCNLGLEGIISKDALASYAQTRNTHWLKLKCEEVDDFKIIGFIKRSDSDNETGALILAVDKDESLLEVGKVGTGFDRKTRQSLYEKLKSIKVDSSVARTKLHNSSITWVEPIYVAQIRYTEFTNTMKLRHPVYLGIREDASPTSQNIQDPTEEHFNEQELKSKITSANKVLYKKGNITKLDLATYYNEVYKFMRPHIVNKILTLLKCPEGLPGDCFYNKHIGSMKNLKPIEQDSEHFFTIYGLESLIYLIRYNALEIHSRNSPANSLNTPNELIFDLDPDVKITSSTTIDAAFEFKEILEAIGLKSFCKVTGGKGIHIHVPLSPIKSTEEIYNFSKSFALVMEENNPKLYTTNVRLKNRESKIYIDYLRNNRGASYICPFSTRAKNYAPLALPVSWKDLKAFDLQDPITLGEFLKTIHKFKTPWQDYWDSSQTIDALDQINM